MRAKRILTMITMVAATAVWAGERAVIEAILIRVNDRIVTVSDFRDRVRSELSQLPAQPQGDELRGFVSEMFNSVVDELVLLERAQEKKMAIEEESVDQAIAALREENQLEDDAAFATALAQAGLSEKDLRERYRQSMLLQRVVQSEIRPTEITEEEIRTIYEAEKESFRVPAKTHLEQLFFPAPEDPLAQRELLRRVLAMVERIRGGADLIAEATLAGVEVQDLGAIPDADLRPELKTIIAPLADGGLSDPIEIPGGIQVIRLVRRVPAGYEPFDSVKEAIRRRESMGSYQEQSQGLVARLRVNYLVELHRERLALVFEGWTDAS